MNTLLKIQTELKIPKAKFNKFGGFSYRNCEDILEAVKPLLAKYDALLTMTDDVIVFGEKLFVNVGSVGQPRDGDPRAAYAIYDLAANTVELRRVPYDVAAAQKLIRDAGLPEQAAARLAQGR